MASKHHQRVDDWLESCFPRGRGKNPPPTTAELQSLKEAFEAFAEDRGGLEVQFESDARHARLHRVMISSDRSVENLNSQTNVKLALYVQTEGLDRGSSEKPSTGRPRMQFNWGDTNEIRKDDHADGFVSFALGFIRALNLWVIAPMLDLYSGAQPLERKTTNSNIYIRGPEYGNDAFLALSQGVKFLADNADNVTYGIVYSPQPARKGSKPFGNNSRGVLYQNPTVIATADGLPRALVEIAAAFPESIDLSNLRPDRQREFPNCFEVTTAGSLRGEAIIEITEAARESSGDEEIPGTDGLLNDESAERAYKQGGGRGREDTLGWDVFVSHRDVGGDYPASEETARLVGHRLAKELEFHSKSVFFTARRHDTPDLEAEVLEAMNEARVAIVLLTNMSQTRKRQHEREEPDSPAWFPGQEWEIYQLIRRARLAQTSRGQQFDLLFIPIGPWQHLYDYGWPGVPVSVEGPSDLLHLSEVLEVREKAKFAPKPLDRELFSGAHLENDFGTRDLLKRIWLGSESHPQMGAGKTYFTSDNHRASLTPKEFRDRHMTNEGDSLVFADATDDPNILLLARRILRAWDTTP